MRARARAGERFEFVFFPDCGSWTDPPTASCLSQWATTPFESDGHGFRSAEQAMMHGKAMLFGDQDMADRILAAKTPFQAKSLGSKVRGFSEEVWARHRFRVVVEANLPKFARIESLGRFLDSTGDAVLAEASPTDPVWGIGLDQFDASAERPDRWPGANLLGFALMEVRAILRAEPSRGSSIG